MSENWKALEASKTPEKRIEPVICSLRFCLDFCRHFCYFFFSLFLFSYFREARRRNDMYHTLLTRYAPEFQRETPLGTKIVFQFPAKRKYPFVLVNLEWVRVNETLWNIVSIIILLYRICRWSRRYHIHLSRICFFF